MKNVIQLLLTFATKNLYCISSFYTRYIFRYYLSNLNKNLCVSARGENFEYLFEFDCLLLKFNYFLQLHISIRRWQTILRIKLSFLHNNINFALFYKKKNRHRFTLVLHYTDRDLFDKVKHHAVVFFLLIWPWSCFVKWESTFIRHILHI